MGKLCLREFQDLGEVLSLRHSPRCSTLRESGDVIATLLLYVHNSMDTPTRTKFQQFKSNPPLLLLKKLIVPTPRLLCGLHTMSLVKAVPDSLKNHEYTRNVLQFHTFPRKFQFKRRCLPSRTRVSRLQLEKTLNYISPSGIQGCAKPFSCMWDQL